jgi:hypothetical protein
VAKQDGLAGEFVFGQAVFFELAIDRIEVIRLMPEGQSKAAFFARAHLRPSGECQLEVGSERLELWQVSRMALEPLFFGA